MPVSYLLHTTVLTHSLIRVEEHAERDGEGGSTSRNGTTEEKPEREEARG